MRRRLRCLWSLLGALALFGAAVPGNALADGSVTTVGSELRFVSDSQDAENLVITRQTSTLNCNPKPTPCLQLANGPQKITGCDQLIFNGQPSETIVVCTLNVGMSIRLTLNDGNDYALVSSGVPPTTMDGGTGDDSLSSDSGADTVLGGEGNDEIGDSGPGGNDRLDGGPGNDFISRSGGNDDVIGGPGIDTVFMDSSDDTIRLDDLANDGPAGTTSNIHADVEVLDGGGGDDNLFGNAASNTLLGGSDNDVLVGGAGPDVLQGDGGADDLSGGPDVDLVVYPDAIAQTITLDDLRNDGAAGELDLIHSDIEDVNAGPGNDTVVGSDAANVLDGGDGDDRLQGGGGADTYVGGLGADALFARDGIAERVDCGAGSDTGEADTTDVLVDCEGVAASSELVPDFDGDGVTKPSDCNDDNPAIRPGAFDIPENGIDEDCSGADAVNLDRDADGVLRPSDCNDNDPRIHPGVVDIPENGVDEDCSGADAVNLDRDADGFLRPSDCNDANAAIRPGVVDIPENGVDEDCSGADAVNLDRDADGFLRPSDCNDSDARINPGAVDIPGNKVDEDCSGGAAPFPLLDSAIVATYVFSPTFTRFSAITIRRVHAGSTLRISCTSRGCPFRSVTRKFKRDQRVLTISGRLAHARLRPGAQLEVRITLAKTVGAVARYTVRAGQAPVRTDRCLSPGAKRPTRCP